MMTYPRLFTAILFLGVALTSLPSEVAAQDANDRVLFQNVNVFDGVNGQLQDVDVLVGGVGFGAGAGHGGSSGVYGRPGAGAGLRTARRAPGARGAHQRGCTRTGSRL